MRWQLAQSMGDEDEVANIQRMNSTNWTMRDDEDENTQTENKKPEEKKYIQLNNDKINSVHTNLSTENEQCTRKRRMKEDE